MATGDIRNNLKKLQKQISLIRYPKEPDYEGLTKGNAAAHLPILYYVFFDYSPQVVESIAKMDCELAGKKDAAFMTVVFKIMREKNPKCSLNLKVAQFMSKGFAERKIILTTDIITFVRTSLRLSSGKQHSRNKPVNAATILGASSSVGQVSNISAIPQNDEYLLLQSTSAPPRVLTAPQMQSTARSALNIAPQTNIVRHEEHSAGNSFSSTIRAAMNDLHSMCEDQMPRASNMVQLEEEMDDEVPYSTKQSSGPTCCSSLEENTELGSILQAIQKRQDTLESENESLRHENMKIKKEIEMQQSRVDLTNVMARLDIIESKLLVIENPAKNNNTEPHSPVCGDNLCCHLNKLKLQHENSATDITESESNDKSLLDVTNDSPIIHTRQQRMKLLDIVQGTRSLLGMSDVSDLQIMEKGKDMENKPPE